MIRWELHCIDRGGLRFGFHGGDSSHCVRYLVIARNSTRIRTGTLYLLITVVIDGVASGGAIDSAIGCRWKGLDGEFIGFELCMESISALLLEQSLCLILIHDINLCLQLTHTLFNLRFRQTVILCDPFKHRMVELLDVTLRETQKYK